MALFPSLFPNGLPRQNPVDIDLSDAKPTPKDPNTLIQRIYRGQEKVTFDDLNKVIDAINQIHARVLKLETKP